MIDAPTLPFPDTARTSDPATSHEAAARASAASSELGDLIVATVARSTVPPTAEAIADEILRLHPNRWRWGTVVSAVSRAEKKHHRLAIAADVVGVTSAGCHARTYVVAGGHA